jgi:DNA-binding GntR family transcriptional regulator
MTEPRFLLKRDYIVEQIRHAIQNGELKPGQKLRQEELAARFQISSTPVREALRKLEAEGLVKSVPHQGVYVARLSLEELEEHYRLRVLLECYATRLAVENLRQVPARCATTLTEMSGFQAELKSALAYERRAETVTINHNLHLRLYEEANSPRLKQMITDLWKQLPFNSLGLVEGRAEQAYQEHEELFGAIREGDATTAEQIIRRHIEISGQVFDHYLRALPPIEE